MGVGVPAVRSGSCSASDARGADHGPRVCALKKRRVRVGTRHASGVWLRPYRLYELDDALHPSFGRITYVRLPGTSTRRTTQGSPSLDPT